MDPKQMDLLKPASKAAQSFHKRLQAYTEAAADE